MAEPEVEIRVRGMKYTGWKSVQIKKSITSITGTFQLSVAYESGSKTPFNLGIYLGDYVEILSDGVERMIGWVDDMINTGSPKAHTIVIKGRSLLSDLVDCSYVGTKTEWIDTNLIDIVKDLTADYSHISVTTGTTLSIINAENYPFKQVTVQQGDSIFDTIKTLCLKRAVLPMGGVFDSKDQVEYLDLTTVGTFRSSDALLSSRPAKTYFVDRSHNILSWSINESNIDRFSDYTVKGTASNLDTVNSVKGLDSGLMTAPSGQASDSAITRYRPLVVISDGPGNAADLKHQAEWESMTRAGKSRKVSYTIQGWTTRDGEPWDINWRIPIQDIWNNIDADLLSDAVIFTKSLEGGTTTTFELVHPDTYFLPTTNIDAGDIKGTFDYLSPEPYKAGNSPAVADKATGLSK